MTTSVEGIRLKKRFEAWDVNKNGVLDTSDFEKESEQIAQEFGVDPKSPKAVQLRSALVGMFQYLSEQAGGYSTLSEEQFLRVTEKILSDGEASLSNLLRPVMQALVGLCDKNDDGKINQSEFAAWIKAVGSGSADGKAIFRQLDTDGSGDLTVDELLIAVRDYHLGRLDVDLLG